MPLGEEPQDQAFRHKPFATSPLQHARPEPAMFTTRPEIKGTFGVVASTHWIASAVGMSMLEKGGNAFDACVATGLALQILEPHLCGPGGDLPAIYHSTRTGKTQVLCAQGVAPA